MSGRKTQEVPTAGFTLLELLVVLMIAGMLIALTSPLISAAVPGVRLRVVTMDFAASLREARNRAISRVQEIDFIVATDIPRYGIAGEKPEDLPGTIDLIVRDANRLATTRPSLFVDQPYDDQFTLRFYPDGSASGAAFMMSQNGSAYQIDVDWLVGRVIVSRDGSQGSRHAY